ncbi:cystatin-8-like [Perognathus longimembris pacificus]|uniref:cystatin-8-like n=1 Tax=Perognathus longimembris pacificus TaxID=214514 RepID=UPI00201A0DF5|nr:cystatin-8-like [Perognathus longimembris pacificus]
MGVSIDPAKKEMKVLRPFKPVNVSNVNVKQCVWFAMQEYNKNSEDKYIFLVVKIPHAQLQITDRLEYLIDVRIARSNCRKPLNNSELCAVEENSEREKNVHCSFLVGALPWNGEFDVLKKQCFDV